MAVVLIGRIQEFVGLSSDTKPTAPPVGSTFRETDTGIVAIYDGTAWQGAGEVKAETVIISATESVRKTLFTPTSGKKARIIAVMFGLALAGDTTAEVYFGTDAGIDTTPVKAIARGTVTRSLTNDTSTDLDVVFPDRGGPVGAVDEVVSSRVANDIDYHLTVVYREE